MPRIGIRRLGFVVAIAFVPAAVMAAFFTTSGGAVIFILLVAAGLIVTADNSALLSAALTVGLLVAVGTVALLPDLYYRPDERFGRGDRYDRNVSFVQDMLFGDLVAIGGSQFATAAESRRVRFVTDGEGWRNARPYAEGDLVLIGDSFIVGSSSDQGDMLGEKIQSLTGHGTYSIASPSAPADYLARLERFGRPAWLFVFEGNDLFETDRMCALSPNEPKAEGRVKAWRRAFPLAGKTRMYWKRTGHVLRSQFNALRGQTPPPLVERHAVGGREMLFYAEYVATTGRVEYEIPSCLVDRARGMAKLIRGVFFIPTKYRVYHGLLDSPTTLPADGNWRAVQRFAAAAGVPAHDLTPALVAGARTALPEGRFVYWRDDTHWNGLGAETVAREFARLATAAKDRVPLVLGTKPVAHE